MSLKTDKKPQTMLDGESKTGFRWSGIALILVVVLLAMFAVAGTQCKRLTQRDDEASMRSVETTPGEFASSVPPAPQLPPPPMLRDPESAVYSYLLWVSYAYRILDSDVASATFSEWEEVRVNSYVEMNRQKARAIDQRLTGFEPGATISEGSTATVPAREKWAYRYISARSGKYSSPTYEITYDTTYTVVQLKGRGWVVDRVQATPVGAEPE